MEVGGVCPAGKGLNSLLQCIGSAADIAVQGAPTMALNYTQGA